MKIFLALLLSALAVGTEARSLELEEKLQRQMEQLLSYENTKRGSSEEAPQEAPSQEEDIARTINQKESIMKELESVLEQQEMQAKRDDSPEEDIDEDVFIQDINNVGRGLEVSNNNFRDLVEKGTTEEDLTVDKYTCYHGDSTPRKLNVKEASLKAHNDLRVLHGVPKLEWSDELLKGAKKHANWMAKYCKQEHSAANGYGENIASKGLNVGPIVFSPAGFVHAWYSKEVAAFDFGAPVFSSDTGHFTQIAWKETTHVGCSLATKQCGKYLTSYYCCQYTPSGNLDMPGELKANVLKPTSKSKSKNIKTKDLELSGACDYFEKCPKYAGAGLCKDVPYTCPYSCP